MRFKKQNRNFLAYLKTQEILLPVAFLVWNSVPNNLVFLRFLGSFVPCYHFLLDEEQLLDDCGLAYHLPINT